MPEETMWVIDDLIDEVAGDPLPRPSIPVASPQVQAESLAIADYLDNPLGYNDQDVAEFLMDEEHPTTIVDYEGIVLHGFFPKLFDDGTCNCGDCKFNRRNALVKEAITNMAVKRHYKFTTPMFGGSWGAVRVPSVPQRYTCEDGTSIEFPFPKVDPRVEVPRYSVNLMYKLPTRGEAIFVQKATNIRYLCEALLNPCSKCGKPIKDCMEQAHSRQAFWVWEDGSITCDPCFSDSNRFECECCHDIITKHPCDDDDDCDDEPNYVVVADDYICRRCRDEYYDYCEGCDNLFEKEQMHFVDMEDVYYCDDCFDRSYTCCRRCDCVVGNDDTNETQDGPVCDGCYEEYYAECVNCEEFGRTSDGRWDENHDEFTCSNCCENQDSLVQNHSYKPRPRFYKMRNEPSEATRPGETQFFGFELEVENVKNIRTLDELCQMSDQFWDDRIGSAGLTYYKHDGSLNYGVEIVSHPISWGWFLAHRADFETYLDKIKTMGFRSWSTRTCGLHIHMNKSAFNGQRMYKFMKFFHENGEFIYSMSGRKNMDDMTQWAQIDDDNSRKNLAYEAKNKAKQKFGRYWAVNLEPSKTMEIRIFKGTLRASSFMRAFEFLRSLYLFTANGVVTIKNTTLPNYIKFVKDNLDEHDFRNLRQTLIARRFMTQASEPDGEEN